MAGNSMRDIKRRIKSNTSMGQITNAMKLVSAAKLRRAKLAFEGTQKNFNFVLDNIREVFQNAPEVPDRYLPGTGEVKKTAYIVITSNRGLCGSFNANVIKEAAALIQADEGEAVIIAVGSRGRDFFEKRGYEIVSQYLLPPEDISFADARNLITKPIVDMYVSGEIDKVVLVSTKFITTLTQESFSQALLPLQQVDETDIKEDEADKSKFIKEVEYGPSIDEVFDYLVPKYLELTLYSTIIESATSEHAARRMAMESATDNANEMIDKLTLHYNRARQAAITREITEIVGGAEALS